MATIALETEQIAKEITSPLEQSKEVDIARGVNALWHHFENISNIPRDSGDESEVGRYIMQEALHRNFKYAFDKAGNILVTVPATDGYEHKKGILLQAHQDMVCIPKDKPNSPNIIGVIPEVYWQDGEPWVRSQNNQTTLGADNGIGLSLLLALMSEQKNIPHGPLALLFTTGEETNLNGVKKLNTDVVGDLSAYQFHFNLDAEKEGEAIIESAGAGNTIIELPLEREPAGDKAFMKIKISGLRGGHSGVDIADRGRANANKVMASILRILSSDRTDMQLVNIQGGNAANAIPTDAEAVIAVNKFEYETEELLARVAAEGMKRPYPEENISIIVESTQPQDFILTIDSSQKAIQLLHQLPHGILHVDLDNFPDKIEPNTSTNLAIVNTDDDKLKITMMTRSSILKELESERGKIQQTAERFSAQVKQEESYTGWKSDPDGEIAQILSQVYHNCTGKELSFARVHAGLENGVIVGKYPHLQSISFGPTIEDAHSTNERVNVASVTRFYYLVSSLISEIANQKTS